jgi:hypothetical protein
MAEGAWDIGGAGGCLTSAVLIGLGAPLASGLLLSLAGAAVWLLVLRRYYARLELAPSTA